MHVSGTDCAGSHSSVCERDFRNDPSADPEDIALFQTIVRYLLSMQVSAEPVKTKSKTQTIKANGATINISGSSSGTSSDSSGGGGASQPTPYRLCFSPREPGQGVPPSANCGSAQPKDTNQQITKNTTIDGIPFASGLTAAMLTVIRDLPSGKECSDRTIRVKTFPYDTYCYEQSVNAFAGRLVKITLQFRSTASIFNFLGQLVSAADDGHPYPLYARSSFHAYPDDWPPCWELPTEMCKPIIAVRDGTQTLVSIAYDGSLYAVPGDPKVSYSPDVFTVLKQLVALNLSGKNLPTTAILSVTSP